MFGSVFALPLDAHAFAEITVFALSVVSFLSVSLTYHGFPFSIKFAIGLSSAGDIEFGLMFACARMRHNARLALKCNVLPVECGSLIA